MEKLKIIPLPLNNPIHTMKHIFQKTLLPVFAFTLFVASCGSKNDPVKTIAVTGISVNPTEKTVDVGATFVITAQVTPDNATNKQIQWTSSDAGIAKVENGTVTAVRAGKAVISATTVDGNKRADTQVTVKSIPVVQSISLNAESKKMVTEESFTLVATIAPADAIDKTITWTSSNDKVVSVDAKGVVKAVAMGEASVTAKSADGKVTATCKFSVVKRNINDIPGNEL